MPKYIITLTSTTDPTLHTSGQVTLTDPDQATEWAEGIMHYRRCFHPAGKAWNLWTVAELEPRNGLPRVRLTGRAHD